MIFHSGSVSSRQSNADAASSPAGAGDEASPPASRRRVGETSSPLPLAPTSPATDQHEAGAGQFSSPQPMPASEIDLSSPLNYGTPSSKIGNTPRGTPYPFAT